VKKIKYKKTMTNDELDLLVKLAKQGDENARKKVLIECRFKVETLAKMRCNKTVSEEEMTSVGNEVVNSSIDSYKLNHSSRGVDKVHFITYVSTNVYNAMSKVNGLVIPHPYYARKKLDEAYDSGDDEYIASFYKTASPISIEDDRSTAENPSYAVSDDNLESFEIKDLYEAVIDYFPPEYSKLVNEFLHSGIEINRRNLSSYIYSNSDIKKREYLNYMKAAGKKFSNLL